MKQHEGWCDGADDSDSVGDNEGGSSGIVFSGANGSSKGNKVGNADGLLITY